MEAPKPSFEDLSPATQEAVLIASFMVSADALRKHYGDYNNHAMLQRVENLYQQMMRFFAVNT